MTPGKFRKHVGLARHAGTNAAVYARFEKWRGEWTVYVGQSYYGHAGRYSGVNHAASVQIRKDAQVRVIVFESLKYGENELTSDELHAIEYLTVAGLMMGSHRKRVDTCSTKNSALVNMDDKDFFEAQQIALTLVRLIERELDRLIASA